MANNIPVVPIHSNYAAPPVDTKQGANASWNVAPTVEPISEVWASYTHFRNDFVPPNNKAEFNEILESDPNQFVRYMNPKNPVDDPKRTPGPEHSNVHHQSTYRFYRDDFGHDVAYRFNGDHFSMANHLRTYPIYGMNPVEDITNTYRTEPPPRDITIQTRPPQGEPNTPQAVYTYPTNEFRLFDGPQSWRVE
jgi:hypothetical protein